jgi:hypothetical protein
MTEEKHTLFWWGNLLEGWHLVTQGEDEKIIHSFILGHIYMLRFYLYWVRISIKCRI